MPGILKNISTLGILLLLANVLYGQLIADFASYNFNGVPTNSGCSPLVIVFNDSSTINGNAVPYMSISNGNSYNSHVWDFDQSIGGISYLQNPVYVFIDSDTFNVTLTVTNNGVNYETESYQIIVFPTPVVDFIADVNSGCNPLTTCFTDLSVSVGSPITNWIWDFDDGGISGDSVPCHTFYLPTNPNQTCFDVTLIVTNTQGCTGSKSYNDFICIDPPPVANFGADTTLLCNPPFIANFADSSISNNSLTYLWNFGDITFSTLPNPTHQYALEGVYSVTLIVTDTSCNTADTIIKPNFIRARTFEAILSVDTTTTCEGTSINFTTLTTPIADIAQYDWDFGDATGTDNIANPSYNYPNSGTYITTLTLTDVYGCVDDTSTSLITVNPQPSVDFTGNNLTSCQAPLTANFVDLSSADVIAWDWTLGPGITSAQQNPTYTYGVPDIYDVSLTVTNNFGCTNSLTQTNFVQIDPTMVSFTVSSQGGCIPLLVTYTDQSSSLDPIVSRQWVFGDPFSGSADTSTAINPTHTYNNVGIYNTTLTITTQMGCVASYTIPITTGVPPVASFTPNPMQACVNTNVNFISNSTGTPNLFDWNFGDGNIISGGTSENHQYAVPGFMDVTLTVSDNGCVDDTTITIEILPPLANFTFTQNCNNPGVVNFTDLSITATDLLWDFGDGPPTSTQTNPTHIYTSNGTYTVSLTATNSNNICSHTYVEDVIVTFTSADFSSNITTGCAPLTVDFDGTISLGSGLSYSWNFGDPTSPDNTSTLDITTHIFNNPGDYTITLIVTDANNCTNTMVKSTFINVSGINTDFNAPIRFGCLPDNGTGVNIDFTDLSVPFNSSIASYEWDFGDTSPRVSVSAPTHNYSSRGLFTVMLIVGNNAGCLDTMIKNNYIDINDPVAEFSTNYNLYCGGQDIQFTNNSTGDALTYFWDFGDPASLSDTSIIKTPSYTYNDSGMFSVLLAVEDRYGCRDSIIKNDFVSISYPAISFIGDDTFKYCPPHLVNFSELIQFDTINIKAPPNGVLWDFGDGSYSNLPSPSHIYNWAGEFTVSLYVQFENGCRDTLIKTNYIDIGGAVASLSFDTDTGCIDYTILMDANSTGAVNLFWLFGDGNVSTGGDTITYTYVNPGVYTPAVIITDSQIPACTYTLYAQDTVVADTVYTYFLQDLDTVCERDAVVFIDSSTAHVIDVIDTWFWDFGDGNTDTVQNPVHYYYTSGYITVTLTATNLAGCSSSFSRIIFVRGGPNALFSVNDSVGCDTLTVYVNDLSSGVDTSIANWFWDFGDHTSNFDTFSIQNPSGYFYQDTGNYNINLVVTDASGCTDTATQSIQVNPIPQGISAPSYIDICFADTITISGDTTALTYIWNPAQYISDPNIVAPGFYPPDTTLYTLLTTDLLGCQSFDSVTINVNPLPLLTVSPVGDTVICIGDIIQLFASGGGNIFTWTPPTGLNNQYISNPLASPLVTTSYKVQLTNQLGCNSLDSINVIVSNLRANAIIERSCLGDSTSFFDISAFSDLQITSWSWDFGDTNTTNDVSNSQNSIYLYPDSGYYIVQLEITDSMGCVNTFTDTARVDFPPNAYAFTDTTICNGQRVRLYAGGGEVIFWEPSGTLDSSSSFNPIATPNGTTTYTANVTNGVCPYDDADVEVTIIPNPTITPSIDSAEILEGTEIQLETYFSDYDSIWWLPPDSLSCINCESPYAHPSEDIMYYVYALNTQYNCLSIDSILITIFNECDEDQVFVGNTITPNGDGINDMAYARLYGLKSLNYFKVFDRWGHLMFETVNETEGWKGTNLNNKKLNTGVYVYYVEATCYNGLKVLKKGNVTIIK